MRPPDTFRAIIVFVTASAFVLVLPGRAFGQTALRLVPETSENVAPDKPKVREIVVEPAPNDDSGTRFFGKGAPFEIHDLPESSLKTGLLALEPAVRKKAMDHLHSITFQHRDAVESLRVDRKGGVFHACSFTCGGFHSEKNDKGIHSTESAGGTPVSEAMESTGGEKMASEPEIAAAPVPISSPPAYHSKPGAPYHIYLDFNGAIVSGKDWTRTDGTTTWTSWDCHAWSMDADRTTFSDQEQASMKQTWERVAEDYAPFNVNVTTDVAYDPITYTGDKNKVGWILITPITDKLGAQCPHYGVGGIAYGNVYGATTYFAKNQPAWVAELATGSIGIAQAASHEMGHNMGLTHDNTTSSGYYGGHNSTADAPSWGPIMGTATLQNVTQWSKGEYYLANQFQDDLTIIAGKLSYRTDDHGGTYGAATVLNNAAVNINGIIERTNDNDVFSFTTGAGVLNFDVTTYKSDSATWGGNLDVMLELYNSSNALIASNNRAVDVNASISQNVAAGSYYIVVKPTGAATPAANPPSGYTVYGSLGQYTLTGNFVPAGGILATHPTGGEILDSGANENITWASGMGGNVKIELYKAGSLYSTIINSTPNDGSYTWAVAANLPIANDYKIKITSVETPAISHTIPNNFGVGRPPIYFANMNTNPGWTFSHASWAYGVPNGIGQDPHGYADPVTGYNGNQVIGYNLNGDYEANISPARWATTPTINCSNHKNVKLSFYRWLGVEGGFDSAYIEVLNTGGSWTQVWRSSTVAGVNNDDGGWVYCEYDISSVADGNAAVSVRWGIQADDQWHFCGWNLDDVKVDGDPAFSITYHGNGSTGGTVPVDAAKYISGATVTALSKGGLVKSGNTFVGWNTEANGSGIAYAPAATFNISANTTLYAQWTITLADWAASNSLTGGNAAAGANPDGDALINLQEFSFGTNPTSPAMGPLSYLANGVANPGIPILENIGTIQSPSYRAVFVRRKNYLAAGISYQVQFSANLQYWKASSAGLSILSGESSSAVEAVSVPFPATVPLSVAEAQHAPPKFFRVSVAQN